MALTLCLPAMPASAAAAGIQLWYAPDNDTPDLADLFKAPEKWSKARSLTSVMKFGPQQLERNSPVNSITALQSARAFDLLRSWGIKIAVEEGAIKEWDCTGMQALEVTRRHLENLSNGGARAAVIAFDSPLLSAVGPCNLAIDEAAARTAKFVAGLSSAPDPVPELGDIEPYPRFRLAALKSWIGALKKNGWRPSFLHLDIDMHYVDLHPELPFDNELEELAAFLKKEGIRLGFIIWSGYDPLSSDRAYYDRALRMATRIRVAVHRPDELVLQSWVTRSPIACVRPGIACRARCSSADPPYCGTKSIPLNLPETPGSFSHTNLLNTVAALFR